jgi:hypothetical protein
MGTLRVFARGAVEGQLDAVGPDRICFGTDAPLYFVIQRRLGGCSKRGIK